MTSQLLIGTATGMLDAHNPGAYTFRLSEIAKALSTMNRFNGHRGWDPVAAHCVRVSLNVEAAASDKALPADSGDREVAILSFLALHHDSSEAYLGDQLGPIRTYLMRITQALEVLHDGLQNAILTSFLAGVAPEWRMLQTTYGDWLLERDRADGRARLRMSESEWLAASAASAIHVESDFLLRHAHLMRRIQG